MLQLPPAWNECSTAYVVKHLLRQTSDLGQYAEAAHAFTKAAIDFMIAGPRWDRQRSSLRLVRRKSGWRLNDWVMHILPATSDEALFEALRLARRSPRINILTPPWSSWLVEHAVRSAFPEDHMDVIGLDMFCAYRTLFTGVDLNQSPAESRAAFFRRYQLLTASNPAITLPPLEPLPPPLVDLTEKPNILRFLS